MPQVENEEMAEIAYNCFAESQNWRDSSGLGLMMNWRALRDDLRIGWGKVITCIQAEMEHRQRQPRGDTHGTPDTHGAVQHGRYGTEGASGDPVPPGARGGSQTAQPNVPQTGPHPEESPESGGPGRPGRRTP